MIPEGTKAHHTVWDMHAAQSLHDDICLQCHLFLPHPLGTAGIDQNIHHKGASVCRTDLGKQFRIPASADLPESFRTDPSPVGKDRRLFLPHRHRFFQDPGEDRDVLFDGAVIVIIGVFVFSLLLFRVFQLIIPLYRICQDSIRKIQSTVGMDSAAQLKIDLFFFQW